MSAEGEGVVLLFEMGRRVCGIVFSIQVLKRGRLLAFIMKWASMRESGCCLHLGNNELSCTNAYISRQDAKPVFEVIIL